MTQNPGTHTHTQKIHNFNYIKISLFRAKHHKPSHKTNYKLGQIFVTHFTEEQLISQVYKEFLDGSKKTDRKK